MTINIDNYEKYILSDDPELRSFAEEIEDELMDDEFDEDND